MVSTFRPQRANSSLHRPYVSSVQRTALMIIGNPSTPCLPLSGPNIGWVAMHSIWGGSSRAITSAGWSFTEQVSMTTVCSPMRDAVRATTSSKLLMETQ